MSHDGLKVIAVTRKPDSASFEHRVLDYVLPLRTRGVEVEIRPLPAGFTAQRRHLRSLAEGDVIFWHRHLLNPLQRGMLRRAGRPVVFDFDDPLVYSSSGGYRPSLTRRRRFAAMLGGCAAATPASEYLAELARPHVRRIQIIPMAVPLDEAEPARAGPVELLWLGGAGTQPYLEEIRRPLEQIGRTRPDVKLRLVAHEPIRFGALQVDYRKWSPHEQASALRECHIGLCPMPDTPWTRGKCPYKVLQYMAASMPWVGSRVGENILAAGLAEDEDARGLCAAGDEQWTEALRRLIDDPDQARRMGQCGRAYAELKHGIQPLADRLSALFGELVG